MRNSNSNNRHILVVDDEPLVRRSLSEFLTLQGYAVTAASSAKEALGLLENYNADIVIADIKMPEMDGVELLKKIKIAHPETPVILITSYGSIENAVEAIKEGAYDYITKPIVDSEIKIVIERLIKQRQLQEENIKLKEQLSAAQRESISSATASVQEPEGAGVQFFAEFPYFKYNIKNHFFIIFLDKQPESMIIMGKHSL